MRAGLLMVFQNYRDGITDVQAYERDVQLAGLAEPLGFDTVSGVEHHFFNYAMAPDNMQFLSYMAAITKKIGLLTGAVILPWHNPLRVVEKMILLDHLSKGRAIFGIGRGLAKREYDVFGIDMNEARDRFRRGVGDDHPRSRDRHRRGSRQALSAEAHRGASEAVRELQGSLLLRRDVVRLGAGMRTARCRR
jgi:hypothetical protein